MMRIRYSLGVLMILILGAGFHSAFTGIIKPATISKVTATQPVPASVPAPISIPVGAASGTGIITSVASHKFYPVDEIEQTVPHFFETYAYRGARLPVETFDITFTSRDFDRSAVEIHAQVFIPVTEQLEELPVYVFASGTTGIGDLCAPSLEQPELRRWGWYRQNMLAYASLGYIVIFPDYTGFHDETRAQRYFSKSAEGYMLLDAIRAIFKFFDRLEVTGLPAKPSRAVFTSGYSQGGHAAFAAADLHPGYAPEVPLAGVITFGSTNDVQALVQEGVAYAPLILYSYMMIYGREQIDPADYLLPKWLPSFETDASTMSVDVFQRHYGFDAVKLYTEKFCKALSQCTLEQDFPALARLLAENHTGFSGHRLPALIIQGSEDFIVTNKTQTKFVNRLQELGSRVQYIIYPGVSHRNTRAAGFEASVNWMEERIKELEEKYQ